MSLAPTSSRKGFVQTMGRGLDSGTFRFSIDGEGVGADDEPLARTMPSIGERFAKLASTLKSSRPSLDMGNGRQSVRSVIDAHFEMDMLVGMNQRQPEKCSWHYKSRRKGTMMGADEGAGLPRGIEDVRRRQEHVERRVVQTPVLVSENGAKADGEVSGIRLIREAFLSELRDLYTIVSSIETRRYDICRSDVRGLFEWYSVMENFLRVYFFVSESAIYRAAHVDSWEGVGGVGVGVGVACKERRLCEKKKIIGLSDKVQAMKRVLLAEGEQGGQKSVGVLRERVDRLAVRLRRFLDAEVGAVGAGLERRYPAEERGRMFRELINAMHKRELGRDMAVVVARAAGRGPKDTERWLVRHCERARKAAVQRWVGHCAERHGAYVRVFETAEFEYRSVYRRLGRSVDQEMDGLHQSRSARRSLEAEPVVATPAADADAAGRAREMDVGRASGAPRRQVEEGARAWRLGPL